MGQRAGTRSARERSRLKQRDTTEDVDDETTDVRDDTPGVGENRTELTAEDDTSEDELTDETEEVLEDAR